MSVSQYCFSLSLYESVSNLRSCVEVLACASCDALIDFPESSLNYQCYILSRQNVNDFCNFFAEIAKAAASPVNI